MNPDPLTSLLVAAGIAVLLVVLFAARWGLVTRWQQTQEMSARILREDALKHYHQAVRIFNEVNDKKQTAETLFLEAAEQNKMNQLRSSRNTLNRALSIFREMEDLEGEVKVLHRLAAIAEQEAKYNTARSLLKKLHGLYVKLDRNSAAVKVERHLNALPEKKKK